MAAYYFRVIDDEGVPTGWVGFVHGRDVRSLFFAIDQFVDPYSVEVKTAVGGGYCYKQGEDPDWETSGHEFLDYVGWNDKGWRKPLWNSEPQNWPASTLAGLHRKQMAESELELKNG